MGKAAEKFPLPGLPPERIPDMTDELDEEIVEDITDELDELVVEESTVDKILRKAEVEDETTEALRESEKLSASGTADKEIKAKLAEKEEASKAAMKKKMATDKTKANLTDLRAKLADLSENKKMEKELSAMEGRATEAEAPLDLAIEKDAFALDGAMAQELDSFKASGALPESFNPKMYLVAETRYEHARSRYDEVMSKGFFSRLKNRKKIKLLKSYMDDATAKTTEGRDLLLEARKGTPEAMPTAPKTISEEDKALAKVEGRDLPEKFHKNKYFDTAHLVDELQKEVQKEEGAAFGETKSLQKKRKDLRRALDALSTFEDQLK